jgi:peptidoglycan/xylan/chitin deacetylase (PgdA/CDA1 family)
MRRRGAAIAVVLAVMTCGAAGSVSLASTPQPRSASSSTSAQQQATALPLWLSGAPITRLPTSRKEVALTFDGGAGAQGARSILATLKQTGVPATFFLTGNFVHSYPRLAARLGRRHYLVGNHSNTHPDLTTLSSARVTREVTRAQTRIEAATGVNPTPWFRFPFGAYDGRTVRIVHHLGYGAIGWTVDTLGWEGRAAGTVRDVVRRVRAVLEPGEIVLMHLGANPNDGTTFDADALPRIIRQLRAAGYSFVNLATWSR